MVTQLALRPNNWTKPTTSAAAAAAVASAQAALDSSSGGAGGLGLEPAPSASSSSSSSSSPAFAAAAAAAALRGGLMLTAGLDWSTRLWALERPATPSSSSSSSSPNPAGHAHPIARKLCEFRGAYEQVSDVCWSPTHPSLFATAHGGAESDIGSSGGGSNGSSGGHLRLWDLCHSTEDPVVSLPLASLLRLGGSAASGGASAPSLSSDPAAGGASNSSSSSLSKMAWSYDGRRLALGDLDGRVHILALANDFADPEPQIEYELDRILHKLHTQACSREVQGVEGGAKELS